MDISKGPFIIYGRGGPEILRGATYFWQVADGGGPLIFGAKNFEKARETHVAACFRQKYINILKMLNIGTAW